MDTLSKVALAAGTGLIVGAAVQYHLDSQDKENEKRYQEQRKLQETIRDQRDQINELKHDQESCRRQIKILEQRNNPTM